MKTFEVHHGDCLEVLRGMPDNSVDSVVTDPPYGLSFMGKKWDYDVPSIEVWAECFRVLKPGGHLLAFAGTRTQHRMAVRIEDAGFEIRDMIAWVYGSGFPKSHDVSKAIDKASGSDPKRIIKRWNNDEDYVWSETVDALKEYGINKYLLDNGYAKEIDDLLPNWDDYSILVFASDEGVVIGLPDGWENNQYGGGNARCNKCGKWIISGSPCLCPKAKVSAIATEAARQWQGWGTALKPALEPITVARKPLIGTVAENVLAHGTGGLNIDGCRVGDEVLPAMTAGQAKIGTFERGVMVTPERTGRWPANLIHDGGEEVLACFPDTKGGVAVRRNSGGNTFGGDKPKPQMDDIGYGDSGSAARFFYCAKASKRDRDEGLDGFETKQTIGGGGTNDPNGDDVCGKYGSVKSPSKNHHPTVKPTDLMRYLCRLVTPPNGIVLDPFTGSGSTGKAAVLEGFQFIGIEREAEYVDIARARILNAKPEHEEQQLSLQGLTVEQNNDDDIQQILI